MKGKEFFLFASAGNILTGMIYLLDGTDPLREIFIILGAEVLIMGVYVILKLTGVIK